MGVSETWCKVTRDLRLVARHYQKHRCLKGLSLLVVCDVEVVAPRDVTKSEVADAVEKVPQRAGNGHKPSQHLHLSSRHPENLSIACLSSTTTI